MIGTIVLMYDNNDEPLYGTIMAVGGKYDDVKRVDFPDGTSTHVLSRDLETTWWIAD